VLRQVRCGLCAAPAHNVVASGYLATKARMQKHIAGKSCLEMSVYACRTFCIWLDPSLSNCGPGLPAGFIAGTQAAAPMNRLSTSTVQAVAIPRAALQVCPTTLLCTSNISSAMPTGHLALRLPGECNDLSATQHPGLLPAMQSQLHSVACEHGSLQFLL
jgi:hypothetical protein